MGQYPDLRMRRTRQAEWSRTLVRETRFSPSDLIWPLFIFESDGPPQSVSSMPGVEYLSVKDAIKAAKRAQKLGIPALALFPKVAPVLKNARGSEALNDNGLVPRAIQAIKDKVPEIGVIVDIALDPYTDHGQDGLVENGKILNDPSVEVLVQMAAMLAQSGADIVAPSDMMDGRVGAIRTELEASGFSDTMILAYAAKYASGFYGPFRHAVGSGSALKGDKRTYQMDPANTDEALREIELDLAEGADMVMVKPGLPCLDIIHRVKSAFGAPTFAYQVSGEYALIKAASDHGWLEEEKLVMESMLCLKRAGAGAVLTYFAPQVAERLQG